MKGFSSFMEYFKVLPSDITLDILTRLPAESVLQCKSVSKTWYTLISSQSFSKKHSNHHLNHLSTAASDSGKLSYIASTRTKFYFFEYNENPESAAPPIERIRRINLPPPLKSRTIVGSCNGLICLAGEITYNQVRTYVCNPITREYVRLPEIREDSGTDWACGFGYVSSTDEYKVAALVKCVFAEEVEVYVYTLGSGNGWRKVGEFKPKQQSNGWEHGVFANGALYWWNIEAGMITTFDLAEENFYENLSPPPRNIHNCGHKIGVLNGVLFFAALLMVEGAYYYDIWLLKKKNGNHEEKEGVEHQSWGWTNGFRVRRLGSKLLDVTKSNGVLLCIHNYLNIWNIKASTFKRLVDFKERVCEVVPHKNTLLSLKELGEEDTKIMGSIEIEVACVRPSIKL